MDLLSSEVELVRILNENELQLENMDKKHTYRLRKMEYNLRKESQKRGENNLEYHLGKIVQNS